MERDRSGGIDIYYSPRGVKADELIKQMVARAGEEIMVVTSDREVASFVERRGGTAVPSQEFEAFLTERRRKNGKSINEGEEEEEGKGKKKKGPSRRLSRRERLYRQRLSKL